MKQQGFTLIEFLLGFTLLSVILLVLFNVFFFINRMLKTTTQLIETNSAMVILSQQLKKDFEGLVIPLNQLKYTPKDFGARTMQEQSLPDQQKPIVTVQSDQHTQAPKLSMAKDLFVLRTKGDLFSYLSFVSTTHIATYQKGNSYNAQPSLNRITYNLIENPMHKNTYSLYRHEKLFDAQEETKKDQPRELGHIIADNIIKLLVSVEYPVFAKNEQKKDLVFKEYKSLSSWDSNVLIKKDKHDQVIVPYVLRIVIRFKDPTDDAEQEYMFKCTVASYAMIINYFKLKAGIEDKPKHMQKELKKTSKEPLFAQYKPSDSLLKKIESLIKV